MRENLARGLHLLAVLALLTSTLLAQPRWLDAACAACVLATLLQLPGLSRLAQGFCAAGLLAWIAMAGLAPQQGAAMQRALAQGTAFACLLVVLGLLRYPVRRSPTVRAAASWLLGVPLRRRYAAVNLGSHGLSLLFNVGIIPLIGDLMRHAPADGPASAQAQAQAQHRMMVLAAARGTALMTVWSPMGLGFAIVTTSIAGLDTVAFIGVALACALALLAITCASVRHEDTPAPDPTPACTPDGAVPARPSPWPLVAVLLASALLLALTLGLHAWQHWSFLGATVLVLPLFALAWLQIERPHTPAPWRQELLGMFRGVGEMRMESAIFLSANVVGAALALWVQQQPLWQALQGAHFPALPVLALCLLILPAAGALYIPHSIFVVLLAQLLGRSALGQEHPMALALALSLGWAAAIAISPISAMSLLTSAQCGASAREVGMGWNRGFVAQVLALSLLIVGGCYLAGW